MRRIGLPCKQVDYLETVEYYTLKTSQCKKGKNADSKTYTLSVQHLHGSQVFYILKFNRRECLTIGEPTYYTERVQMGVNLLARKAPMVWLQVAIGSYTTQTVEQNWFFLFHGFSHMDSVF